MRNTYHEIPFMQYDIMKRPGQVSRFVKSVMDYCGIRGKFSDIDFKSSTSVVEVRYQVWHWPHGWIHPFLEQSGFEREWVEKHGAGDRLTVRVPHWHVVG